MLSIKNNFFNKHIFLHTHIEKCGGSTLIHYLETLFGKERVCDLRPYPPLSVTHILESYPEIKKQLSYIKLLTGHIHYDTQWSTLIPKNKWVSQWTSVSYFCKKPLYIASIRHPIDRLVSLFRYVRTRPEHMLYDETVKSNNIDSFIQKLIQTNSFRMNNEVCTLFIGRRNSPQPLEEAKEAFHHNYFAVVPYDKTHKLANMLAGVFELPKVTKSIINPSEPSEVATLSLETRALLEDKCRNDILFYHYMMNYYPEKLVEAEKRLKLLA